MVHLRDGPIKSRWVSDEALLNLPRRFCFAVLPPRKGMKSPEAGRDACDQLQWPRQLLGYLLSHLISTEQWKTVVFIYQKGEIDITVLCCRLKPFIVD